MIESKKNDIKKTVSNFVVRRLHKILWPDEKHFYFLIWFFHPSKEFDTLSEDDHLPIQLSLLEIKSD